MSNDVNRFDKAIIYTAYLLIGPLQTIAVLYFLWQEVGVSSVLGVASLIMFIPFQGKSCFLRKYIQKGKRKTIPHSFFFPN